MFLVDCTDGDAPPALITPGEPGPWDYEPAPDVCNGPNLYAYVKQNPWTMWDPEGLESFMMGSPWDNRYNMSNPQYAAGFNQGAAHAARVAAPIAVGVVATVYTGGAAAPVVAQLGLGTTGTMLTTAAISGATGGTASQVASNALTGQPLLQNVPQSAATGAALNMAGGVLGQSVQGFNLGLREGTAIATAKELAKGTAAGGAPAGAANAMVSAEGQVFTGLSKNAGGGPVSPAVSGLYGSARTTCAEARALTAMEQAGVNPQGAVSASASVGVIGLPAGTPMPACKQACAPVLRNAGIGDAVAGTSPTLAPVRPAVPVKPTTEDKKK